MIPFPIHPDPLPIPFVGQVLLDEGLLIPNSLCREKAASGIANTASDLV